MRSGRGKMHFEKRCDDCGEYITMALDTEGRWRALDTRISRTSRYLYTLDRDDPEGAAEAVEQGRRPPEGVEVFVAHFEVCAVRKRSGGIE